MNVLLSQMPETGTAFLKIPGGAFGEPKLRDTCHVGWQTALSCTGGAFPAIYSTTLGLLNHV
jgi:hypothetical protein